MSSPEATPPKRHAGAPKGNKNALKHGRTTRFAKLLSEQRLREELAEHLRRLREAKQAACAKP